MVKSVRQPNRVVPANVALDGGSRREKILLAALVLFAERGFAGTSLREIAKSAQVSPALLWRHFENKEQLLVSVDGYVEREVLKNLSNLNLVDQQTWTLSYLSADILRYLKRGLIEPTPRSMQLWLKIYQISFQYNQKAIDAGYLRNDVDLHQYTMHVLTGVMLSPLFEPLLRTISNEDVMIEEFYRKQTAFEFDLLNRGLRPEKDD